MGSFGAGHSSWSMIVCNQHSTDCIEQANRWTWNHLLPSDSCRAASRRWRVLTRASLPSHADIYSWRSATIACDQSPSGGGTDNAAAQSSAPGPQRVNRLGCGRIARSPITSGAAALAGRRAKPSSRKGKWCGWRDSPRVFSAQQAAGQSIEGRGTRPQRPVRQGSVGNGNQGQSDGSSD